MKKIIAGFLLMVFSLNSSAGYNANFVGTVTEVLTYTYSTQILIRVQGQPKTHLACTNLDFLVIASDIPNEARQLVMSRLLLAYTTGQPINIGYDSKGDCVSGRIRVHRVG